jgi:alpha-D-ribose 1-methylphosphonate 5-triphosphate synthase subunit PhnG
MTDEFRSADRDGEATIVRAAIRLAQQISKTLGAGRGRRSYDEMERAAILREAFQCAAGAVPHDAGSDRCDGRDNRAP